ncbi:hypothetical protein ACHWQZ_G002971 [Mnemiopsis leidyi]
MDQGELTSTNHCGRTDDQSLGNTAQEPEVPDTQPSSKAKGNKKAKPTPAVSKWTKKDCNVMKRIFQGYNDYKSNLPTLSASYDRDLIDTNKDYSPHEIADLLFFSDEVLMMIKAFTEKYAAEKNDPHFRVSLNELKVFFSIILLSGGDKCAKVRPVINKLNELFIKFSPNDIKGDVDEAMIPYFGKYGGALKQSMRNKSVRFGYKAWCLNFPSGYLHQFNVYQGAGGSKQKYTEDFGLGGSVVLSLVDSLKSQTTDTFHLFTDNFFNSPKLLVELSRRGILATGTFRSDRLEHCPLPDMKKTGTRGEMYTYTGSSKQGGMVFVRWRDNGVTTIGSNCIGSQQTSSVERWCRKTNQVIKDFNCSSVRTHGRYTTLALCDIPLKSSRTPGPNHQLLMSQSSPLYRIVEHCDLGRRPGSP